MCGGQDGEKIVNFLPLPPLLPLSLSPSTPISDGGESSPVIGALLRGCLGFSTLSPAPVMSLIVVFVPGGTSFSTPLVSS